jgi:hypothetical protein
LQTNVKRFLRNFAKYFENLESIPQDVSIDDRANDQSNYEIQWRASTKHPFGDSVDQQNHKGTNRCGKEACPYILDESLDEAP